MSDNKVSHEEMKKQVIDKLNSVDPKSPMYKIKDVLINAIMSSDKKGKDFSKEDADIKLKQFDNILLDAYNQKDYHHIDRTLLSGKDDLEILEFDYIECIKYILNGKLEKIVGFIDNNPLYIEVSSGMLDLSAISSDECDLKECVREIEALISYNNYSLRKIKKVVNDIIEE